MKLRANTELITPTEHRNTITYWWMALKMIQSSKRHDLDTSRRQYSYNQDDIWELIKTFILQLISGATPATQGLSQTIQAMDNIRTNSVAEIQ